MNSGSWSTHAIEMSGDTVIKRFRPGGSEQQGREWRALTLLAEYAPGMAPVPLRADGEAERPTVVMSRLPGTPLRGACAHKRRVEALAEAVTALHLAVPTRVVEDLPVRPGQQAEILGTLGVWRTRERPPHVTPVVSGALDAGLAWLDASRMDERGMDGVPAVFGPGDGNLANYLWDGARVRVVDFEESGRSDRAFELAEITEHVASWVDAEPGAEPGDELDVPLLVERAELSAAEAARLPGCRRLLALVWLFMLASDNPANPRNPPGTAERQARRLLELLG